jgi:ubiquinone/menaquinone biosynthesis C-methylase UbiE
MDKKLSEKNHREEIASYYDSIANGYDELHFEEQKVKFKVLEENMHLPKDSKVLDVGCGTFFSSDYFDWDLLGIEPSSEMVKLFLKNHPEQEDRIKIGFAEEIEHKYPVHFFDSIICVSVAHHFKNPGFVFEQMKKVCKRNALFGITLLKKTGNFAELEKALNNSFKIKKRIDSSKDVVFICEM